MTTALQLFSLQELDLALDQIGLRRTKSISELEAGITSEKPELALQKTRENLELVRGQHREQQIDSEGQKTRSEELDRLLYAGELTNPRDLESLEKEASSVRTQVQNRETRLLELSLKAEEYRNTCTKLEKQLEDLRAGWEVRSAELKEQVAELDSEIEVLAARRGDLAATFEPIDVQKYEVLRKAKSGAAVAKVLRGLCQGCQMSLPTRQQQQVRSGRQTVHCSSCGRLLCNG